MPENRLAKEPSSYLRSAAHQPVEWHPWGVEAFEKARKEDKPLLLDSGAVWCHWCHVMDRESYEDAGLAQVINERFVAVKVDRDERPDVDARYQKAIQAMTGQGGWPLTAFLLPDGRCFYGGTYYPPRDAHGRPSFRRVLVGVSDAYRERREEILQNADHLLRHLGGGGRGGERVGEEDWEDVLARAVGQMRDAFDAVNGGFGRAPKFPHPAAHDFLLERALLGDAAARDVLVATLEGMRAGGVYDQLAGGFHRYSVDAEWVVPHFEKMLYDNAGLLRNYARAGAALDRDDFRATAQEVVGFLRDVLGHPEGGIGGSQDADVGTVREHGADEPAGSSSVEDDGDFFTWTLDELHAAVPDRDLARLMAMHYHVREAGDMHHDPRRCVLRVEADAEALAAALHRPVTEVESDLARGRSLMQAARAKRKAPFVDPLRYASWNAMAIQALLEHGGLSGDQEADRLALRALDVFLREAFDPARGFARVPGGTLFGLLDDDAQMLDALLEAHFATGERRYLDAARATGDLLLAHFRHPEGGFADRAPALVPPAEAQPLGTPERPIQDAPTASANGVALRALLRLADATGEARYRQEARGALAALAHEAAHLSLFGGALLLAMQEAVHPPPRIVLNRGDATAFRSAARRAARPGATFATPADPGLPEEARAFTGEGALVCLGMRCLPPAATPEALERTLRAAWTPGPTRLGHTATSL
jgi:uncharacterized protein YyaL (SSP411 family)